MPATTTTSRQQNGTVTVRVLQSLEALDRHSFERVDGSNSIDTLYSKIFQPVGNNSKSAASDVLSADQVVQIAKQDEPLVRLLCQWSVSDQRYGEHKAVAAALLLEKRQSDLVAAAENDSAANDDNDAEDNSSSSPSVPQPIYQVIFHFF